MGNNTEMKFHNTALPPLPAGRYNIHVEQDIKFEHPLIAMHYETFEAEKEYVIACNRFKPEANMVYSTYPPKGTEGNYGNCLPHIVLNKPTFPWEWPLDFKGARVDGVNIKELPWFALLLFDTSDPVAFHAVKCAEATDQGNMLIKCPDITPQEVYGEKASDLCNVIDVPLETLKKLMPKITDLPYTVHMRSVSIDNKATGSSNGDGRFSCAVCNRYPKLTPEGERHHAFLVCLLGHEAFLLNRDGGGRNTVRLIVLADFTFSSKKEGFDFKTYMNAIKLDTVKSNRQSTDLKLKNLLSRGYVPMRYDIRDGSQTAALYRSPFLPTPPEKDEIHVNTYSDSCIRYDPRLGMFDMSHAAAWQLGRLLALQNTAIARSLFKWRVENKAAIGDLYNRQHFTGKFNLSADTNAVKNVMNIEFSRALDSLASMGNTFSDPTGVCNQRESLPGIVDEETLTALQNSGESDSSGSEPIKGALAGDAASDEAVCNETLAYRLLDTLLNTN